VLILRLRLILLLAVVRRRGRLLLRLLLLVLLLLLLVLLLLIAAIRRGNLLLRRRRLNGLWRLMLLLRLYGLLWGSHSYRDTTVDAEFRDRHRLAMAVRTDREILRVS